MYVLTSARTFSAGEGIAFILQDRSRAVIVGEQTAGAANPGRHFPINEHFKITVPTGKVVAAVSGGNWEGAGLKPEVPASAPAALRTAHARALTELIGRAGAAAQRAALQRLLAELQAAPDGRVE